MELYTKYRIVKQGKDYAIQKGCKEYCCEYRNFKEGFWEKPITEPAYVFADFKWEFILIGDVKKSYNGLYETWEGEGIVDLNESNAWITPLYIRTYKTKKAAQDALKQHLWDTMVEPINGQENWKQVNKD